MTGRTTLPGDVVRPSWRALCFEDAALRRRVDDLLPKDGRRVQALVLAQRNLKDAAGEHVPHAFLLLAGRAAWVCCYELMLVRRPSPRKDPR